MKRKVQKTSSGVHFIQAGLCKLACEVNYRALCSSRASLVATAWLISTPSAQSRVDIKLALPMMSLLQFFTALGCLLSAPTAKVQHH